MKGKPRHKTGSFSFVSGTNFDKIALVKSGVSKDSLVSFKQVTAINYKHLSIILGTTTAMLHKKQGKETFGPSISEKVIALMDVYNYGYEVFGNKLKFNKWVQTCNRALGYRIPLDVMDTIFGIDEVKNIIGRVTYGVYC